MVILEPLLLISGMKTLADFDKLISEQTGNRRLMCVIISDVAYLPRRFLYLFFCDKKDGLCLFCANLLSNAKYTVYVLYSSVDAQVYEQSAGNTIMIHNDVLEILAS